MAKVKKIKITKKEAEKLVERPGEVVEVEEIVIPKEQIAPLSIDYPHEYLNDMGRKINQINEHINNHG